jgi:hypothetical protein
MYNLGVIISLSNKSFTTFSSSLNSDFSTNFDSTRDTVDLFSLYIISFFSFAILLKCSYKEIISSNEFLSKPKSISFKEFNSLITFLVIIALVLNLIYLSTKFSLSLPKKLIVF